MDLKQIGYFVRVAIGLPSSLARMLTVPLVRAFRRPRRS